MTPKAFKLITEKRFPRLDPATVAACKAVIFDGLTSYAAENAHGLTRNNVNRYVNRIYGEYSFCEEVAK